MESFYVFTVFVASLVAGIMYCVLRFKRQADAVREEFQRRTGQKISWSLFKPFTFSLEEPDFDFEDDGEAEAEAEAYRHEINVLLPQLRSKPLDLTQEFDKILMQRRHALVHRRFSIFDPNNVEIKLSHLKQGRLAMEQANEVSIDLNSNHVQQKVEQYINYLKRASSKNKLSETSDPECKSEEDKNENEGEVTEVADLLAPRKDLVDIDDEPSSDDDDGNDSNDDSANSEPWQSGYNGFTVVDEDLFPPHLFWSGCPLKCKWMDEDGNAHIEFFEWKSSQRFISHVINVDRINRPNCPNWCVEYKKTDGDVRRKSFDSDSFWTCCIVYVVFKTCGCGEWDEDLKQLFETASTNKVNDEVKENTEATTVQHNLHPYFDADGNKKPLPKRVCSWSAWDAHDRAEEKIRASPVDMKDPFYAEMWQRKKAMILGRFELIDRQLKEVEPDNQNVWILDRDYIKDQTNNLLTNNDVLRYEMVSRDNYTFVNPCVFKLSEYDDGHRCIAVWKDDDGKEHEEWFKWYKRSSLYCNMRSLKTLHWTAGYDGIDLQDYSIGRKYCDLNSFWSIAAYFKIFGICGFKQYDYDFYQLYQEARAMR